MKENSTKIAQLLAQAGSAHHQFEQIVLKGVYDEDWPEWYAGYLLDHGLNDLLPQSITQAALCQFLYQSNQTRTQKYPEPNWVDYTTRDLVTTFAEQL